MATLEATLSFATAIAAVAPAHSSVFVAFLLLLFLVVLILLAPLLV